MSIDELITRFSEAIAYAEGYYVPGSRARRNNNPGNLTVDTIGKAVDMDGMFIVYANAIDGWNALKRQVELILTDLSSIYTSDMTLIEIAERYTTTEQSAWAHNVASKLGIPVNVPVSSLITAPGVSLGVMIALLLIWYHERKT